MGRAGPAGNKKKGENLFPFLSLPLTPIEFLASLGVWICHLPHILWIGRLEKNFDPPRLGRAGLRAVGRGPAASRPLSIGLGTPAAARIPPADGPLTKRPRQPIRFRRGARGHGSRRNARARLRPGSRKPQASRPSAAGSGTPSFGGPVQLASSRLRSSSSTAVSSLKLP